MAAPSFAALALILVSGCSNPEHPALTDAEIDARRTIQMGVFGTVEHRKTVLDGEDAEAVSDRGSGRTVRIHEVVDSAGDAVDVSSPDEYGRFDVNTPLVGEATVDADGFYEVALPPGTYSVFIEDGDAWYCNGFSSNQLCPVTIVSSPLRNDILIDYETAY